MCDIILICLTTPNMPLSGYLNKKKVIFSPCQFVCNMKHCAAWLQWFMSKLNMKSRIIVLYCVTDYFTYAFMEIKLISTCLLLLLRLFHQFPEQIYTIFWHMPEHKLLCSVRYINLSCPFLLFQSFQWMILYGLSLIHTLGGQV